MGRVFIECILSEKVFLVRQGNWKMPADMVSFAVSTGLGVSVVAGILSGVCYVMAYGSPMRRKSNRKSNRNLYCDVCGEYFRSIDHILGGGTIVSCSKCQLKVCQRSCAKEQQDGWICKNCLRPPESWFQGLLYAFQPNKKDIPNITMDSPGKSLEDNNNTQVRAQVQDFIEKLVVSMLGQNVDDANVTKLYNDEKYNKIFEKYHRDLSNTLTQLGASLHSSIAHLPLSGQQSPCTAHAALKQLIEKLLQEVLSMPALQKPQNNVAIASDLNNSTYEDLLATAILNKVVSNSQNRPSSSAASVSSRISNSSNLREEKEYFFGEKTLDTKWKTADPETTSVSSIEDWLQSDSSFGSRKYVDKLTLTIKQDIEEVSQISESDEEDIDDNDSEYFRTKSSIWSDDEPNWFLQKRQFQTGTNSPVPVPMLVPNPTTEAKVLIGDKEIDDTSDLSDVESEFGEPEIVPPRHSLLLDSKTVIGGKNGLQNGINGLEGESESESSADSGVKEVDRENSTYDESDLTDNSNNKIQSEDIPDNPIFISKADIHLDDDNVEDASLLSVYSNTEQEAEYTEQYASLPRKIEKKPQPPARPSLQKLKQETPETPVTPKIEIVEKSEGTERKEDRDSDEDVKRVQIHFSGSYSRREKEKWKNAIEMKNNPYSKENIEKRIKRSNSGAASLFGPDYYAKLASSPSGTKAKSPEVKELIWPTQNTETDHIENGTLHHNTEEEKPEKFISKTYIASEEDIHRAEPIVIEERDEIKVTKAPPKYTLDTHPIFQKIPTEQKNIVPEIHREKSPEYEAEITSDSDLSYINFYDVENSQVYKKSMDSELHQSGEPKISVPPSFAKNPKLKRLITVERTPSLRRFKSESDLYDQPDFDVPPKVLPQKKDNTLISKIYKVLSKSDLTEHTTFRTPYSRDDTALSRSQSDDERSRSQQRYSSGSYEISNDTMTITKQMSLSSEDEHSDQSSFYSEYKPIRNPYASNEDLLSVDEPEKAMKKDNTLISKIYQQPQVRNYNMAKKQNVSVGQFNSKNSNKKNVSSDEEVFIEEIAKPVQQTFSAKELNGTSSKKGSEQGNDNDNDINVSELAKKRIVHNILDKFSHLEPNSQSKAKFNGDIKSEVDGVEINEEEFTTSVRELMKKFENNMGKNQVVSSLTARSLSRHTRKPVRN